jgi:2-polyprenyl-6-methoxyphenol hydroxylase-like FAD-dependent oxidoreductase
MTDGSRRRALVIGGSVGGLFAACLLRAIGWEVRVFEKTRGDLSGRGAGLGLSAELFQLLRQIGARLSPAMGVGVSSLIELGRDGAVAHRLERPWLTGAWSRIYRPLRDLVPDALIESGRTLERIEQDGASVTAIFADGGRERGDILVGADGVHSTVRRQFLPEIEARYAGYVAWRGVIEESALSPVAHALLCDSIAFVFPPGEMTLSTPIPGADDDLRKGHRRYYFIWYRPATEGARLDELLTDASGRYQGFAIPPPLIRAEHVAAMRADAHDLLPPVLADIVARVAQPLLQAVTDLEVPRMAFGRAVLMGDAAFIARPHVAAGITKAALDAKGLAAALAADGDIDRALARFEADRRAFDAGLVGYSRYLGAASLAPDSERDPKRVLREYGAPHLLRDADPSAIL